MPRGGAKPGAGRPKGSKTLINVKDYFNGKDIKELVDRLKEQSKTDNKVMMFLIDHLAGKPVQGIGLVDENGKMQSVAEMILALQK